MMLEILYQDEWLVAVNKPSGWLVHRSWLDRDEKVVVMQTVRDQIGQHVFTAHRLDRPTSGVLLMGLSSEAGRLLAQQFEQHQIQKRYHAIVRGWLTETARLDYPLVEELDKIADKFARDDKGPQPAVTDYRGMATTEMPVATSKFPTTRYSLVELLPKTGQTSAPPSPETSSPSDYWRQQARRSAPEPQRGRAFWLRSSDAACKRTEPDTPVYRRTLTIRAGLDDLDAGTVTVWLAGQLPENERVEFVPGSVQDEQRNN
jgi:tRNA pseudouridine65 synthase